MPGLSPKLPLVLDKEDGFLLTKNLNEVARQNLKMLVLTSPGEKIMDPNFGVGIYNFLFEQATPAIYDKILSRIHMQVKKYLPYIKIDNISFDSSSSDMLEASGLDSNYLGIRIHYTVVPMGTSNSLDIFAS